MHSVLSNIAYNRQTYKQTTATENTTSIAKEEITYMELCLENMLHDHIKPAENSTLSVISDSRLCLMWYFQCS